MYVAGPNYAKLSSLKIETYDDFGGLRKPIELQGLFASNKQLASCKRSIDLDSSRCWAYTWSVIGFDLQDTYLVPATTSSHRRIDS
jgi:hypothetical protein